MRYRSWLFVPGDSGEQLGKAVDTGADVIVVDLQADIAGRTSRLEARERAEEWLRIHRRQIVGQWGMSRWVRINPLGTDVWHDDLAAVMTGMPDGIVLPASAGPEAVRQLAAELYGLEQRHGIPSGSTQILPVVGTTPEAVLTIQSYLEGAHPRLAGLAWDAETLAAALGATRQRDAAGNWTDVFSLVRAQVLLVARVAGLMAIDTQPQAEPFDTAGLKAAASAAHADGFAGIFARHPAQVPVIHEAFEGETATHAESSLVSSDDAEAATGAVQGQESGSLIDRAQSKRVRRPINLRDQPLVRNL